MTYGRSVGKALDTFGLDRNKWPELAADRLAWRAMLRSGVRRAVPRGVRAVSPRPQPANRALLVRLGIGLVHAWVGQILLTLVDA